MPNHFVTMTRKQRKNLTRIVCAAVLFTTALLLPFKGLWRLLPFLVPYLIIGYDVILSCLRNIIRGQIFDEGLLMTVATVGAMALGEYAEGVMVMLLYQIGELLQSIAVGRSRRSIAALMDIRPDTATVVRNGVTCTVSPEEVAVGEIILVCPGEKIPLDGIVTEGVSAVNAAALTGESVPQDKCVGDNVISGCINLTSPLSIRVKNPFSESTVMKILELVENASSKKSKAENFITRFARYYTPCIVFSALALGLLPPVFFGNWQEWIGRALVFLVVSCPCALVISVPLSFFGGIGGASRVGILMKGGSNLETLSHVRTVVFDKTGTLTEGIFSVTRICPAAEMSTESLLELTALAESYSRHPIADSVRRAYGRDCDTSRVAHVQELPGYGIIVTIDGKDICVGNARLMQTRGIAVSEEDYGDSLLHVAEAERYLGFLVISDRVKMGVREALDGLRRAGVTKTVMLTGDTPQRGYAVGKSIGIDDVRAKLLPGDKVMAVEELLAEKSVLAYVGDGINDAPVLARADVGIAMGVLGSDAAIEAADVVLMDDDMRKLPLAVCVAKKTMRIVRENICLALGIKGLVLAFSVCGMVPMWLAVFADVGVMLIAVANAMRALMPPKCQ